MEHDLYHLMLSVLSQGSPLLAPTVQFNVGKERFEGNIKSKSRKAMAGDDDRVTAQVSVTVL